MILPKRGEINGVQFQYVRWSIYALAYEYKISAGHGSQTIYVNTLTDLKNEIGKIA